MPVDWDLPEIEIDSNTEYFLRWTVEKYHYEMDWNEIRENFEQTSALVRKIAEVCIEAGNFGSTEFKAVCHAANINLTRDKLQEYIRDFGLPKDIERELLEAVPESFGIVGGATMDITVQSEQAEKTLLQAFDTLLDESSTEEELLDTVENIASAQTKGVKAGRLTPVLSLLWPELFPINNGPTRAVMNDYFGFDVSNSLQNYRAEIPMYLAVRKEFGFYEHGRDFDRYCHWARDETESDVVTWFKQNEISDRTAWQINAGQSNKGEPEKLWPLWQEHGLCSIGWDAVDLSTLSEAVCEPKYQALIKIDTVPYYLDALRYGGQLDHGGRDQQN